MSCKEWPEELRRWAEAVVQDERVIAGVNKRAHNRDRAIEAIRDARVRSVPLYFRGFFRGYDHYANWIVVVAQRLLINEFRKFGDVQRLLEPDRLLDRSQDKDREDTREQVREVIARLPQDAQELLRLRFEEDLGFEEIGERLGCSTTAAWRRMHLLLAQIRRWWFGME
jgi:RNA polymerase sigma factor (sigma-70 family)